MGEDYITKMLSGANRADIIWHPTINYEICSGCGICMQNCLAKVYSKNGEMIEVTHPTKCVLLCNRCMENCPNKAIKFPSRADLMKQIRNSRKK